MIFLCVKKVAREIHPDIKVRNILLEEIEFPCKKKTITLSLKMELSNKFSNTRNKIKKKEH